MPTATHHRACLGPRPFASSGARRGDLAAHGRWVAVLLALFTTRCGPTTGEPPSERPRAAAASRPVAIGPEAESTDVSDVVGKPAPGWDLPTWFNGPPRSLEALRGDVVLVRWFMSAECPYCSATAPNLVSLHDDYVARGLTVIGMYHHKSEAPLVPASVRDLVVDHYRFPFSVAIDDDWKTLKAWWLDAHPRSWTSVSFLVDRRGAVRFVHLGGEYPKGSADDAQMRAWIEELLGEPAGESTSSRQ